LTVRHAYSTYEIDDLILVPLEDLGSLEASQEKLVSFLIYDFFSWYICRIWGNEEIQRYVRGARAEREGANDLYKRLQSLAERCGERERAEGSRA
jgi:hypothetical protein